MSIPGLVGQITVTARGSVLTADAAIGDVALVVEYGGDFDADAGGTVDVNGTQMVYTTVIDGPMADDPDALVLAAPLAAGATAGDIVTVVSGGQLLDDMHAHVSFDDGDDILVPIPFEQRERWAEQIYEDPVPVEVADDLQSIEAVPGRTPSIGGSYVWNPYISRRWTPVANVPDSTWTTPGTWADEASQGLTPTAGDVTIDNAGLYRIEFQVSYAVNGTGYRYVRISVNGTQVGYGAVPAEPAASSYPTCFATVLLALGDVVTLETQQTSGASLAVVSGAGRNPFSMFRVSV